jgi:AcrR family transcriptional regulator
MAAVRPGVDSRAEIRSAAERLIAERGVGGTSLAEIARQAGVSPGTLYYYYPNKTDLVLDIAERHMSELTSRFRDHARAVGAEGLAEVLAALVEGILSDETRSSLHHHLLHGVFEGDEGVRSRMAASYESWIGMVAEDLDRLGVTRAEAGRDAGRLLVAATDGLIIQGRVLGRGEGLSWGSIVAILAAALGAPVGGDRPGGDRPGGRT